MKIPQGGLCQQGVQVTKGVQVPPHGDHVPIGDEGNQVLFFHPHMINRDFKEAILALARALITHLTRRIEPRVNSTMTSRLRDFVRMNPLVSFLSIGWENILKSFLMVCIRC